MSRPTPRKFSRGFTLIEVMVAIFIMAIIGVMTGSVFHSAMINGEATEEAIKRLSKVDRVWVMLENDFRNAIPQGIRKPRSQEVIPAMYVDVDDDYWLTVLRGGLANPLMQPRTETVRVGYRWEDEAIWRDTWFDVRMTEQEDAQTRKILDGVTDIQVRILRPDASSLSAGPWEVDWPKRQPPDKLPLAIEITLELEDFGEIKRIYSMLPGRI